MPEVSKRKTAPDGVVAIVFAHLMNGQIDDAIAEFAQKFSFKDNGIGLEFKDRERLAEFFQKTRQLFPGCVLRTGEIFVSGDRVIAEWTFQATLEEPFYAGRSRTVPVSVHGISVVRIHNDKIIDWSDYYDGLTSRRAALVEYFTEWVEG